jgi:AbrB family looped-hinge helix DNA binding protein
MRGERIVGMSSKGQIVIPKPIREKYRLDKGAKLVVKETESGILLTVQRHMAEEVREIAGELEGKWPKGMTSVDIIRRERGKYG